MSEVGTTCTFGVLCCPSTVSVVTSPGAMHTPDPAPPCPTPLPTPSGLQKKSIRNLALKVIHLRLNLTKEEPLDVDAGQCNLAVASLCSCRLCPLCLLASPFCAATGAL